MSSLLKEEMQRVLFTPEGQHLKEFIEIAETAPGRHFLCVSVNKVKAVQISVVKNLRSNRLDTFERIEEWFLKDLISLDGRDPEGDEPQFVMHFEEPRSMEAVSCAAKYSLARSLVSLSNSHCKRDLPLKNFDRTYIQPTSVYSNRGDCMVLLQICFYAANLNTRVRCEVSLTNQEPSFTLSYPSRPDNASPVPSIAPGIRLYKLIAVCLGLLCLLLLIVSIAVCARYNTEANNTSETLKVMKAERDQLLTNYSKVTMERDQLLTNYSTVTVERDQLLTNYSTVTTERDQLLANNSTVTTEKDQLLANYNQVTADKDKLQRRLDQLNTNCPMNWTRHNSSLYFASKAEKNWWESRLFCINKGADLVIIDNLQEQVFLNGLMKTKHFWIGLSDTEKENKWEWVDGAKLTSGFWKKGEPNDADAEEDCASSEPETNPNKNWNDLPCILKRTWVCERSVCQ